MSSAGVWLVGVVALPTLAIGASFLRIDVERLRRLAVASAVAMVVATLAIPLSQPLRDVSISTTALTWRLVSPGTSHPSMASTIGG